MAKHSIAIFFCGILFVAKPAQAMIPVLDLGEAPKTFQSASNAVETLKNTKAQLDELKASLKAVGDSLQTIAQFGQSLGDMLAEIQEIADVVVNTINETLGTDIKINEKLAEGLSKINDVQNAMTEGLVSQATALVDAPANLIDQASNAVQSKVDEATNIINTVTNAADTVADVKNFAKDAKNIGDGGLLDKANAISEKATGATQEMNKALDVIDSTGLVDTTELRDQVNTLNEQQGNLMNAISNGSENWGEIDALSGNVEGTIKDINASIDDIDRLGIDTTDLRKAVNDTEDLYKQALDLEEKKNVGDKTWSDLKEEYGKAVGGDTWNQLKEQYGDNENFWDTLNDIASNTEDLSKDAGNVLQRLDEAGFPLDNAQNVQNIINEGKNATSYANDAKGGYEDAKTGYKDAKEEYNKTKEDLKEKRNERKEEKNQKKEVKKGNLKSTPNIIEEEEEEIISDLDEDVKTLFSNTKEDLDQLVIQMNDTFDEAIYKMNEGSKLSQKKLAELLDALRSLSEEDIDTKDKDELEKRLRDLIVRSQKVSDWGANIAESAKNRYNREYKAKILDGINNYQKVIEAYANNNATREDVEIEGNILKKSISEINVIPDTGIMISYKKEVREVMKEAENLSADIKQAIRNKQKSS